jgi:hypothetical protein
MTSQAWRTVILVGALTIAGESEVLGCTCPMSGPPCQATWMADSIFVGTVVSMRPIELDSSGQPYQANLVTFDVERGFMHAAPGSLQIVTGMDGGSCGYRFKAGAKYLVYASKNDSSFLIAGRCSRTRPIADALEDLSYLQTMGGTGGGGRVYGRVKEIRRDPAEPDWTDYGPVEGLYVTVRGTTFLRDVLTDRDGRFQIAGLPIGMATISIAVPQGFAPATFEQEFEIRDPRACSQMDLTIQPRARASGFVLDGSGRPVAGVEVDAVAEELGDFRPEPYQQPVRTDERGAFEFSDLPPGRYVFGINLTKRTYPLNRALGASVFLPGTTVASDATVFELKAGDTKEVGVLRLVPR